VLRRSPRARPLATGGRLRLGISALLLLLAVSASLSTQIAGAPPASAGDGSAQLSLPWATGESWTLLSSLIGTGAHSWDGYTSPTSSLDFTATGGSVRAAGDGTVHRNDGTCGKSPGYVRIDHRNGWHTTYYHLANIPVGLTEGSTVHRNDFLGNVGNNTPCGGQAPDIAHVHFTIWHFTAGAFTLANPAKTNNQANVFGLDIGGWTVEWNAAGNTTCLRRISDGTVKCVGDTIYNNGAVGNGGTLQMLLRGDGSVFAKSMIEDGGWYPQTATNTAIAIAASSTGVQMILRGDGAIYAKKNDFTNGNWQQKIGPGSGATAIAVGGDTMMLLRSDGMVWGRTWAQTFWTQETSANTAAAIAASSTGIQMLLRPDGAIYAKRNDISNGNWGQKAAPGTASRISVGADTMMLVRSADGMVWARHYNVPDWMPETPAQMTTAVAVGGS
jgi:murein DD-endopeptidase MepM/ murein hydrolase activator NlpD